MTDTAMFCFQCEQTTGCTACTQAAGACGKTVQNARLQDELTGALSSLSRTVLAARLEGDARHSAEDLVMEGLFATLTNVDFSDDEVASLIDRTHAEHARIASAAGLPIIEDFEMNRIWQAAELERSLRSLLLFGLRGMGAYAYHAAALSYYDDEVSGFLFEGLTKMATESTDNLLPLCLELGKANLACMALLDRANTETFGTPEPTQVSRSVEPGPFIVVSGHDLHDLKLLLDQTEGRGVNVYTHGEMLPAHAYPELKRYSHLKGNIGTAWQNQRQEFDGLLAPILFTSNCIMPPAGAYADRVFTTGPVAFPNTPHIGSDKDFEPVIQRALELGGYDEPVAFVAARAEYALEGEPRKGSANAENGAKAVLTGFGHGAVLGVADTVIDAVKQGAISHFFLVGGCDGARPSRGYFREFVQKAPADSVVLTLACGKYRFNDLDLGSIGGLPRLLDMGQCNDAYSAIKVAVALAEAFECDVNSLPLTLVISWYEQKAACILLTLLHLGIKGIYLGPTLPAYLSPEVLEVLVSEYGVHPTTTPEKDLAAILG